VNVYGCSMTKHSDDITLGRWEEVEADGGGRGEVNVNVYECPVRSRQ